MQSPNHYRDTKLMDLLIERQVPFAEGNIMKYVYRWREKDGIKDLRKARDYLNALIAYEDSKAANSAPALATFPELHNRRESDQTPTNQPY